MKRLLMLFIILVAVFVGCDTADTAMPSVSGVADKTPSIPPEQAERELKQAQKALDEYISNGSASVEKDVQGFYTLIDKIAVKDPDRCLSNIPVLEDLLLPGVWPGHDSSNRELMSIQLTTPYFYVEKLYPTAIRKTETGAYFVLQDKQGARAYLFFDQTANQMSNKVGYSIIVTGQHCKADFDALNEGDSVEKVIMTDSAAQYAEKAWIADNEAGAGSNMDNVERKYISVHYLQEGLLFITYRPTDDNSDLIISKIVFNMGYEYQDALGRTISCTINTNDLP